MKTLSLHGPWAHYEKQRAENETRIAALEGEISYWHQLANEAIQKTRLWEEKHVISQKKVDEVQAENDRARDLITSLEKEITDVKGNGCAMTWDLEAQLSALRGELMHLNSENAQLKQELAKNVMVRSSTHNKLDEARKRLGLTSLEAQVFVKEFDEACRSNQHLRKEVSALQSDRSQLQQQCENRSQHCMTLIAENKRLADQVTELRKQSVDLDQENWRLRQQISAAASRQQHLSQKKEAAAAVCKDRPQWQGSADASKNASHSLDTPVPTSRGSRPTKGSVLKNAENQPDRGRSNRSFQAVAHVNPPNGPLKANCHGKKIVPGPPLGSGNSYALPHRGALLDVSNTSTDIQTGMTHQNADSVPHPLKNLQHAPSSLQPFVSQMHPDSVVPVVVEAAKVDQDDPFEVGVLRKALAVRRQQGQAQLMLLAAASQLPPAGEGFPAREMMGPATSSRVYAVRETRGETA
ncbi:hypothetical protein CEUSTIGMA_g732.t1 [Chlamydomonas eustigma]|uniref:Uncharacterized protein n=1 Tax=Chlamydomonas eustigma TaxID=1157962 RepID=A0A250WR28_9CHLO|nr:hypothetical protein CEUSTIGMA_g732.t1 [Chlamydomonas eustigma]|eukprot:GAX73278.1 hypothetical protein CEUSTIGMA_g732.t1 [Chlamydomonas eustigma]